MMNICKYIVLHNNIHRLNMCDPAYCIGNIGTHTSVEYGSKLHFHRKHNKLCLPRKKNCTQQAWIQSR